jgi:molecular chaperone HscB
MRPPAVRFLPLPGEDNKNDRFLPGLFHAVRLATAVSLRSGQARCYQALKDPIGRAVYLLSLRGIDALAETNTALATPFLQRELERREAMAEAQAGADPNALTALLNEARADAAALQTVLADHLEREAWPAARDAVRELRFLTKVADDLEAAVVEAED